MMAEEWRPCFDGAYAVSNLGRVRRESAARATHSGRLLKQRTTRWSSDYPIVGLKAHGRAVTAFVHRLVAAAFLGPCPAGMQVNHKNGVKADPRAVNLEYVTPAENIAHAARSGLLHVAEGERSGHAKLTADDVRTLRALREAGTPLRELSLRFGIAASTVCAVTRRHTWRSVS